MCHYHHENLYKSFGENEIIKGISLAVQKKEVVVVAGPSGTGKSTLLQCVNLLVKPTRGVVSLFDQPPHLPQARAKVGFLPEHFRFHEWLQEI